MKKLKLDAESIKVESFATKEQASPRGTVHGHSDAVSNCYPYQCWNTQNSACATYGTACWPYCGSINTCEASCERRCTMAEGQTECSPCEI